MIAFRSSPAARRALRAGSVLLAGVLAVGLQAQEKRSPVSKVYVADVSGEALIDTGEMVEDLARRTVYTAQGSVIETKKPRTEQERDKYYSTMVYSNGTGAFIDADTRVEVRRFMQEPFTPDRADVEVEPSISQTVAFVAQGLVGLCTSKLVAGSNMTYQTPLGSVNIRGRKVVIEVQPGLARISMLEGEGTVRSGTAEMGGHTIHAGEQAILRQGERGQPPQIVIQRIGQKDAEILGDKVSMACTAKRTVYFDVRDRSDGSRRSSNPFESTGGSDGGPVREIVPISVVPVSLPVQYTVSPARLTTGG